ncbi:hypothetical protein GOV04_01625 [Candidatus Woesearchaeota archaeon]|nr:hypothetical protein [Candidatus Woesearchaeota archaeon]
MAINETIIVLEPILKPLQFIVNSLKFLVGGIFGLYVIMVAMKYIEARQNRKILQSILNELRHLNKKPTTKKKTKK